MILNHNLKDLQKQLKGFSVLERYIFLEELKHKEMSNNQIANRLEYGNGQMLKRIKPKQFCFMHNDIFGE